MSARAALTAGQRNHGSLRIFVFVQEMLLEDLTEVMAWAGNAVMRGSEVSDFRMLEDLFTFLLVLMGSRNYVNNPHLHAKMSKVILPLPTLQ